jgi:hypothetical protein
MRKARPSIRLLAGNFPISNADRDSRFGFRRIHLASFHLETRNGGFLTLYFG